MFKVSAKWDSSENNKFSYIVSGFMEVYKFIHIAEKYQKRRNALVMQ
jgi:hypothetical protein